MVTWPVAAAASASYVAKKLHEVQKGNGEHGSNKSISSEEAPAASRSERSSYHLAIIDLPLHNYSKQTYVQFKRHTRTALVLQTKSR